MELESLIPSGAGLLATIATVTGMWFKFQNKVENLERDRSNDSQYLAQERKEDQLYLEKELARIKEVNTTQWKRIDMIQSWETSHEKEEWSKLSIVDLKIAELHGKNERFESMFQSIEKKLDAIIARQEKRDSRESDER